ncbi:MAG: Hpt domain-containing protein [Roseibacillus sp.]
MVLEILQDFGSSFSEELAKLSGDPSAVEASNWQDFFHRAKGSGGTLGLVVLQELCAKLEANAKEGQLPSEDSLKEFGTLLKDSCDEAEAFLSQS